jgi:hypothetical protein
VYDWQGVEERGTGEGGPVEGVGMKQVEFVLSRPELEKQVEKDICLLEKTIVSWTHACWL